MNKEVFEAFINGSLAVPGRDIKFEQIDEVMAGNDGLYLFAKFIPALC